MHISTRCRDNKVLITGKNVCILYVNKMYTVNSYRKHPSPTARSITNTLSNIITHNSDSLQGFFSPILLAPCLAGYFDFEILFCTRLQPFHALPHVIEAIKSCRELKCLVPVGFQDIIIKTVTNNRVVCIFAVSSPLSFVCTLNFFQFIRLLFLSLSRALSRTLQQFRQLFWNNFIRNSTTNINDCGAKASIFYMIIFFICVMSCALLQDSCARHYIFKDRKNRNMAPALCSNWVDRTETPCRENAYLTALYLQASESKHSKNTLSLCDSEKLVT